MRKPVSEGYCRFCIHEEYCPKYGSEETWANCYEEPWDYSFEPKCCSNCKDWKTVLCEGKVGFIAKEQSTTDDGTLICILCTELDGYCSSCWKSKKEI